MKANGYSAYDIVDALNELTVNKDRGVQRTRNSVNQLSSKLNK